MRNLQQNLLIIVALSLCGLCVYQWYGQTQQRNDIQKLEQTVYAKSAAIQGYTNSIKAMDGQITQMDARITQLKLEAKTSADLVITQKREINRLQSTVDGSHQPHLQGADLILFLFLPAPGLGLLLLLHPDDGAQHEGSHIGMGVEIFHVPRHGLGPFLA